MTDGGQVPPEEGADLARGRRMLEALRVYQAAESAMRRRTRQAMSMGENELLVLRHLIRAADQEAAVTPTDIAHYLGISSASTTALIDRLEQSGHVARTRHATDRRSVVISTTARAGDDLDDALGAVHERMLDATRGFTRDQADAIISFLGRMQAAVDEVTAEDSREL